MLFIKGLRQSKSAFGGETETAIGFSLQAGQIEKM
jgi:hypothetical protein